MVLKQINKCLLLTLLVQWCCATENLGVGEDGILDFYKKYKEAAEDESKPKSSRRVFINNVEYQLHVNKLKDVNGFKSHNLVIRNGRQLNVNKTIYINNPLESKLPQAYLSFDEFKQALTDRVQKQKEEVRKENLKAAKVKKVRVSTTNGSIKPGPTRVIYLEDVFKSLNVKPTQTIKQVEPKKEKATSKILKVLSKVNTKPAKGTSRAQKNKTIAGENEKEMVVKEQNKTTTLENGIEAKHTEPLQSTTKNLMLRSFENASTDNIIETTETENITGTEPKLNSEMEITTKNTTTNEHTEGTIVPSDINETSKSTVTDVIEDETVTLETETEDPTTTRATLGRPAVFMGS